MMCSRILQNKRKPLKQTRFYYWSEKVFNSVIAWYGRTLTVVLRYRFITLLVTIGTLVGTLLLYVVIPKGFFPVQDTGVILGIKRSAA